MFGVTFNSGLYSISVKTQSERVEKILVAENQPSSPRVPYVRFERAPSQSTADCNNDDSMGDDIVLTDVSDGDTRSIDWLLDDGGWVNPSYNFSKGSA